MRDAASVLLGSVACFGCSDVDHRLGSFASAGTSGQGGSASGQGGSASGQGGSASEIPGATGPCLKEGALDLIDDMEDGDGSIDTQGRAGLWFSFNDATAGAVQTPRSNAENFSMQPLVPPRGTSHYAAHTSGSQFEEWGAGIGFDLRVKKPYDASSATGLAFWARAIGESTTRVRLNVPDRNTSSLGGVCDEAKELCNDSFGSDLELSSEFRLFSFDWSDLTQQGWSGDIYPALRTSEIYGIRFQAGPVVAFEFEIDDIAFTCSR